MCDGHRDEVIWMVRSRRTGAALVTPSGYDLVFSDEVDAQAYVATCANAPDLEVVAVSPPDL